MATVRLTKDMIERILRNARLQMDPAVARAKAQHPDASWGQRIYDTIFAEVKPLLAQLPPGWFNKTHEMRVAYVAGYRCNYTFPLSSPQPWPQDVMETDLMSWRRYEGLTLKERACWNDLHDELVAYNQRISDAVSRQDQYVAMVRTVLGNYSTLAPALKAWPPLWDLLPESVQTTHKEVKTREKAAAPTPPEVDLTKLTALSTAAKFGV